MDPYDYAATLIGEDIRAKIATFWQVFASKADAIEDMFSRPDGGQQDIVEIMQGLNLISPDLSWEFGPSDRGSRLCVTAEFRDDLRPLARLVRHMAPDLPRWRFVDARPAEDPAMLEQIHQNRFGSPIVLEKIEAHPGFNGRIDQVGEGVGTEDELYLQVLNISTLLLGEEVERDWIGQVDATPKKAGGLFGIFGRRDVTLFDPIEWQKMIRGIIRQTRAEMPDVPFAKVNIETRARVLSTKLNMSPDHRRNDLMTFYATREAYLRGALSGARFSSRCHSRHGEWFMYLRIPRTEHVPFDHAEDRGRIEDRLHELLSGHDLGGVAAAGHGRENVYIDFAVTDVGKAIALIQSELREAEFATGATLHFLDQGMAGIVVPATLGKRIH